MLYYLDYKHISYDYCSDGDFENSEDFINSYRCQIRSVEPFFYTRGDDISYVDGNALDTDINYCGHNKFEHRDFDSKYRMSYTYKINNFTADEIKSRVNVMLRKSILTILSNRRCKNKIPLHRNYTKFWFNAGITYRYAGVYLQIHKKRNKLK